MKVFWLLGNLFLFQVVILACISSKVLAFSSTKIKHFSRGRNVLRASSSSSTTKRNNKRNTTASSVKAPGKKRSSASRKRAGKRDEILEIVERIHSGKRGGLREIMIAPSGQSLIFDKKTSNRK